MEQKEKNGSIYFHMCPFTVTIECNTSCCKMETQTMSEYRTKKFLESLPGAFYRFKEDEPCRTTFKRAEVAACKQTYLCVDHSFVKGQMSDSFLPCRLKQTFEELTTCFRFFSLWSLYLLVDEDLSWFSWIPSRKSLAWVYASSAVDTKHSPSWRGG